MRVRRMREDERAEVGELRVATYVGQGLLDPGSDYVATLRALDADEGGAVLVAEDGGRLIGTVTVRSPRSGGEILRTPDEAEVRALAVAPHAQRRGTGRLLLHAAAGHAARCGARRLVLSTMPAMVGAQRMYAAEGFARLTDRDWEVRPGLTLLVYGLALPTGAHRASHRPGEH